MRSAKATYRQIAAAAAVLLPLHVAAADPFGSPRVTISDLYSPNYGLADSAGYPFGTFVLMPIFSAVIEHDNNVFATSSNRKDDIVLEVNPELRLLSNWSRHSLELAAGLRGTAHEKYTSEDTVDVFVRGRGTIDIHSDLKLSADAQLKSGHEARGTGESFKPFDSPLQYNQFDGGIGIWKRFNRLWTSAGSRLRSTDVADPKIRGTIVDQQFRDEQTVEVWNRTGYEVSPKTSIYGETAYQVSKHETNLFNSDGIRLLAGVEYEFSRLLRGDIAVGYLSRNFDSNSISDVDTWTYNAQVFWDPTPLAKITVAGRREVGVSLLSGTPSARVTTELGVRADYELRHNLRLSGTASYEWLEFESAGYSDNVFTIQAGAEYFLSPNWSILLNDSFVQYDQGLPGLDYGRNTARLGVRGRF